MRKLAREAVIFMLLAPVVVFVGSFAYLYHAHKPARLSGIAPDPLDALGIRADNPSADLGAVAVPKKSSNAPDAPNKSLTPVLELLKESLLIGLYGFPAGLGFWAFYRTVRFAIKG